jgi:adenine deaminase
MSSQMDFNTSRALVDTAMGRKPADLVIRKGNWVCVQSGETIPEIDIAIKKDRIAYVGPDASHTIGEQTQIIEAAGRFMVPGLLDAHMHVESGMLTVTEFVRAILVRGTTGIFIDPHEIANVFGLKGVKLMVDEAADQPIHVWVQMPSCVPSAPGFETPGASISREDVAEAMSWDGIIGLGEMMNFPAVINSDEKMHAEMFETRRFGKVIGGHYASPDLGLPFHGYVAGGPEDDHEGTRLEDAIARVRQGMKAMLRLGSAWHDVEAQARAITDKGLDSRHFILCTDDSHSRTLVYEGHMDRVVKHAIDQGLPPITAIQMATLNPAAHFGLARDLGQIAPGRFADIVLVNDLKDFQAELVIAKGMIVAEDGRCLVTRKPYPYPDWATKSVNIGRTLSARDFKIPVTSPSLKDDHFPLIANVIGVIENQAPTRHLRIPVTINDGEIKAEIDRDIAKVALVERHQGSGNITIGLVQGFGFNRPCAVASTIAHDSHHMLVVGTNDSDMALAANELVLSGGGQVVVRDSEVIGLVELPIAGLMSSEKAEIVAEKAGQVLEGFKSCGCFLNNPNMQLSLLALVVIPELRISDQGLVDVTNFKMIPLVEKTTG